jgi:pyruvate dehydrogenase E1 component alpha subunit
MAKRPLSVIKEDGTSVKAHDPQFDQPQLLDLYRIMVTARAFDERALKLQRQGRIGFFAPSSGQEAAQAGSALALEEHDWIFPAYRELAVALARRMPIEALMGQLYGNQADPNRGRQMPNHYGYRPLNFVTPSSPIGTHIIHATGWALAEKITGGPGAAIAYFGDGATSSSDFHAGLNFAGVYRVPAVFLCQNNGWAISLPREKQTASETLAQKAEGYGMEGILVDGNDPLAVYTVTRKALRKARRGEGATLIEALTWRMGPHSSSDDPGRYRDESKELPWHQRDPLVRFQTHLQMQDLWDEQRDQALWEEVREEIGRAVEAVESAQPMPLSSLFEDVFEQIPAHLDEQRKFLIEEYKMRQQQGEMGHFEGEFPL